MFKPGVANFKN